MHPPGGLPCANSMTRAELSAIEKGNACVSAMSRRVSVTSSDGAEKYACERASQRPRRASGGSGEPGGLTSPLCMPPFGMKLLPE